MGTGCVCFCVIDHVDLDQVAELGEVFEANDPKVMKLALEIWNAFQWFQKPNTFY